MYQQVASASFYRTSNWKNKSMLLSGSLYPSHVASWRLLLTEDWLPKTPARFTSFKDNSECNWASTVSLIKQQLQFYKIVTAIFLLFTVLTFSSLLKYNYHRRNNRLYMEDICQQSIRLLFYKSQDCRTGYYGNVDITRVEWVRYSNTV